MYVSKLTTLYCWLGKNCIHMYYNSLNHAALSQCLGISTQFTGVFTHGDQFHAWGVFVQFLLTPEVPQYLIILKGFCWPMATLNHMIWSTKCCHIQGNYEEIMYLYVPLDDLAPLTSVGTLEATSVAYMLQWTGSVLVQVMFDAKPLPEWMLTIIPLGTNFGEIWIKITWHFIHVNVFEDVIWSIGGHFVHRELS